MRSVTSWLVLLSLFVPCGCSALVTNPRPTRWSADRVTCDARLLPAIDTTLGVVAGGGALAVAAAGLADDEDLGVQAASILLSSTLLSAAVLYLASGAQGFRNVATCEQAAAGGELTGWDGVTGAR
jgi:hypothetical protein